MCVMLISNVDKVEDLVIVWYKQYVQYTCTKYQEHQLC